MNYAFDLLGVSPILDFFNRQHQIQQRSQIGVEYVGAFKCTLDALIQSVEPVPPKRGWNMDRVVDTVIDFWMNNSDTIQYWNKRLKDAGSENLLVARVGDIQSIKAEFEDILGKNS